MTAVSTNPTDSVVYVTSQVSAGTTGGTATYEQGSGVLIAPDEVLTAAHVVYDAQGRTFADTLVSPGYQRGSVYGVVGEASIHAMPVADWTRLSGTQGDFALIHLATPITDVPVMALGSDFDGGAVTVTGYPAATSGLQDSVGETVTKVAGYGVLQGTALGAPGDAHGASGGPVWHMVDGVPTVVGLTSSESGSTGYFLQLTSADVAQIQSWMAEDRAGTAAAVQRQASGTAASGPVTTTAAATAAPTAADAIAYAAGEAGNVGLIGAHGFIDRATSRVVALLTRDAATLGTDAGFDTVAATALSQLGDNGQSRNLAAALLEGLIWGHDGGSAAALVGAVSAQDPGIVAYHGALQSAEAGFRLGQALQAHGF